MFEPYLLGIDPGTRHTGWCVTFGTKVVDHGVIHTPRRDSYPGVLGKIVSALRGVHSEWGPHAVVVEEVVWRGRRGMLPLAHLAGAFVGQSPVPVYLITPAMKTKRNPPRSGKWSEHEKDAYKLTQAVLSVERALLNSQPVKPSAVLRRRITVPRSVRGTT